LAGIDLVAKLDSVFQVSEYRLLSHIDDVAGILEGVGRDGRTHVHVAHLGREAVVREGLAKTLGQELRQVGIRPDHVIAELVVVVEDEGLSTDRHPARQRRKRAGHDHRGIPVGRLNGLQHSSWAPVADDESRNLLSLGPWHDARLTLLDHVTHVHPAVVVLGHDVAALECENLATIGAGLHSGEERLQLLPVSHADLLLAGLPQGPLDLLDLLGLFSLHGHLRTLLAALSALLAAGERCGRQSESQNDHD